MLIQTLGFDPAYEVEIDPEYPPAGEWSCPVFAFDHDGHLVDEVVTRWGSLLTLRVNHLGSEWVGHFPADGLGGLSGVFACPAPAQMCVVVGGLAFLVDVGAPAATVVAHVQVGQVVPVADVSLLLLVRFLDIVAVGPAGIAWSSPRLACDGLRVLHASADGVRCTADYLEAGIVLDPATGQEMAESR